MTLTTSQWHQRFLQQAEWTWDLRKYIYEIIGQTAAGALLDIGCGTGALLDEFAALPGARVHGLDINLEFLSFSTQSAPGAALTCGDAHAMPYAPHTFDILICHYLFLWLDDPALALREMVRVAKEGAMVIALAEPDYGGRIDYPQSLSVLADWQVRSLRGQGADPHMGRRLQGLFSQAGLVNVETGVLGGQWKGSPPSEEIASEWTMLEKDLEGFLGDEEMEAFRQVEEEAWERGERVLYVPTFYGLGKVVK